MTPLDTKYPKKRKIPEEKRNHLLPQFRSLASAHSADDTPNTEDCYTKEISSVSIIFFFFSLFLVLPLCV
jgi:hypothetical protein